MDQPGDGFARLMRLLAEHLERWLDGDELAFETLGEAIEQAAPSEEDLRAAAWVLEGLALGPGATDSAVPDAPGRHALRVLSAEERASLSTEAWGYLLGLRREGSLDPGQFERVLDLLSGCGVRPVSVDLAREVAARVALRVDGDDGLGDLPHGDIEHTH